MLWATHVDLVHLSRYPPLENTKSCFSNNDFVLHVVLVLAPMELSSNLIILTPRAPSITNSCGFSGTSP